MSDSDVAAAISIARKVDQLAGDQLAGLARHFDALKWPAPLRALVWRAVASKAMALAVDAESNAVRRVRR